MDPIDTTHWPPFLQWLFGLGTVIAGTVAWWIGSKGRAPRTDETLRRDMEKVVEAVKVAAFVHADQIATSSQMGLAEQQRRIDDFSTLLENLELEKRLRRVEELTARLEERVRTLLNQRLS